MALRAFGLGDLRVVLGCGGIVFGCGAGRAPDPPAVVLVGSAQAAPAVAFEPSCPPSCIPDTGVPDTVENRAVIAVCERYRNAVIAKDVPLLLSLASPRYYEPGTSGGDDVVDRAGLEAYLKQTFPALGRIRYELHYRRIVRRGAKIHVEHTSDSEVEHGGETRRHHEENTLVLEPSGGGWVILSGM